MMERHEFPVQRTRSLMRSELHQEQQLTFSSDESQLPGWAIVDGAQHAPSLASDEPENTSASSMVR